MEKPKILSDEQISETLGRGFGTDHERFLMVGQAQLDADVAYYEPIVQEFWKIRDAQSALEGKLNDVELALQQARQEVFEEIEKQGKVDETGVLSIWLPRWVALKSKWGQK